MRRRVLVLINDSSRRGRAARVDAVARLIALGFDVVPADSDSARSLADQLRDRAADIDLVVVGGGDGTLNSVADALVEVGKPFGILPLGTANDLARTLGIPTDLASACLVIAHGHRKRIDLGRVNGKHFFNVASVGLSVTITDALTKERKSRFGVFAYLLTAVQAVATGRPFHADLIVDGERVRVKTVQIAVGNGRHYGGGLTIAADAAIDDNRLDVYSLEVVNWWSLPGLVLKLKWGMLSGTPAVRTLSGRSVQIVTRHPRRVNTDGEITTQTPALFDVRPLALEVFVPETHRPAEAPSVLSQPLFEFPGPQTDHSIRRLFKWVGRHDLLTVGGVLGVVLGLLGFLVVSAVIQGDPQEFDRRILHELRAPDDPSVPVGPRWLTQALTDVTALGGYTVLTLITVCVVGAMLLQRRFRAAGFVSASALGGAAVTAVLKNAFARPRPQVVPHLVEVTNASFPSGHSAMSAVIYLTLGVLVARGLDRPALRAYALVCAMVVSGLVGVSRVYLGVHYPTDVVAGWALGLSWAILSGLVARRSRRRNGSALGSHRAGVATTAPNPSDGTSSL